MLDLFKIKFGKAMVVCFLVQQILAAACSWALVDFIRETTNPESFRLSKFLVLILVAVSPYIPGFIANYYFHMWTAFGRSENFREFLNLIDGKINWVFNLKKRDQVFALQRENFGLIDETTRFFYLNFPLVLNLIFNSVAIGILLGKDIIGGMLAGLFISVLQFFLVPYFTESFQRQKQDVHYEAEKTLLGSWQTLTLKNQPFHRKSLEIISETAIQSEFLSNKIFKLEAITNTVVLIASFCPLTLILLVKFKGNQLDQIFLMSLGVLLPRILQIFNMSSNLILAGQSLQALRIKWKSYQERLSGLQASESFTIVNPQKPISVIDVTSGSLCSLENALRCKPNGRFLLKGANGSGKSTLCLEIKGEQENIFYLPAKFENPNFNGKGSTGQNKLLELTWLSKHRSNYTMIILDEWDANLDSEATAIGDSLISNITQSCLVFEVRHKEGDSRAIRALSN